MKILSYLFNFSDDQSTYEEIRQNIINGMTLSPPNLTMLFCANIIASIGLYVNSPAVIIGAMLISPIMGSIICISFAVATMDLQLFKVALKTFFIQVMLSVTGSFLLFVIIPSKIPTTEILARTHPSIFDIGIAFFGGVSGFVANTRRDKMVTAIAGVSISTALMPPLATVGFGVAYQNFEIALPALTLFAINVFFIGFATFILTKAIKFPVSSADDILKKTSVRIMFWFIATVITSSALLYTGYSAVSVTKGLKLDEIINKQLPSKTAVVSKEFNFEKKEITLVIVGDFSVRDEVALNLVLDKNGFEMYTITMIY